MENDIIRRSPHKREHCTSFSRNDGHSKSFSYFSLAQNGHYKFQIYKRFNPSLEPSPFINLPHPLADKAIKFRLGSHKLPIETGRWKGIGRADRVCTECNVLGDEDHFLFRCTTIRRDDLMLPENLFDIWTHPNVFQLIARLMNTELL